MFKSVVYIILFLLKYCYVLLSGFNQCESNPCENDGVCIDVIDGHECECESGYTGPVCEAGTENCNLQRQLY